jgi:hypothetical protein
MVQVLKPKLLISNEINNYLSAGANSSLFSLKSTKYKILKKIKA